MRSTQRNRAHSPIMYVQSSAIEYIVDYGFGQVASLVFGAGGLGHEASGLRPPLASPAPWRGVGLGTGTRLRAPALAVRIEFSFSPFRI
jgi:hypothetical protein